MSCVFFCVYALNVPHFVNPLLTEWFEMGTMEWPQAFFAICLYLLLSRDACRDTLECLTDLHHRVWYQALTDVTQTWGQLGKLWDVIYVDQHLCWYYDHLCGGLFVELSSDQWGLCRCKITKCSGCYRGNVCSLKANFKGISRLSCKQLKGLQALERNPNISESRPGHVFCDANPCVRR